MAKKLQASGRYSDAEVLHIFTSWNEFLETLSVEEFTYDNMDDRDYDRFRWRSRQMTDFFVEDIARLEAAFFCPGTRIGTKIV